jgi:hypothetical protein
LVITDRVFVVLVSAGFTLSSTWQWNASAALIKLAVYVPAALIVKPFHVYGSWLQIVVFVVLVTAEFC